MDKTEKTVYRAYTHRWPGIVRQMISEAHLQSGDSIIPIKALWDTGATRTCISPDCAQRLNLISTGRCTNMTASGSSEANTYLVDVLLPNKVIVADVMVTEVQIGLQGFDLLIGMDLISMGDFSVSNHEGKTVLSYRIPSKRITDYVFEENIESLKGTHGKGKRKKHK